MSDKEIIKKLMRVLEQLLIEIEPYRYAQRLEIEKLVKEKKEWAEIYNRTRGNSNEMWFYSTEYERMLNQAIEPLTKTVAEANIIFDKIERLLSVDNLYIEDY